MESAGHGDIVDIMPGHQPQRPILPPAGNTAINQPWITGEAFIGPKAQSLHNSGPTAFDQAIGLFNKLQQCAAISLGFQIKCYVHPSAQQHSLADIAPR